MRLGGSDELGSLPELNKKVGPGRSVGKTYGVSIRAATRPPPTASKVSMMKHAPAVCIAMLLFASGCAGRHASMAPQPAMVPADCATQPYPAYYPPEAGFAPATAYPAEANPGFFGRLMEMERRKNAWLRRTFLGE